MFSKIKDHDPDLFRSAQVAMKDVLKAKKDEKVLIITNPERDVAEISYALYDAALELDAKPVLVFQPVKNQLSFAEEAVIGAIGSRPDILISMSHEKLGKDAIAAAEPFEHEGRKIDNTFHYLLAAKKVRSFWSPSVTKDIFIKTVPLNYEKLKKEAAFLEEVLNRAVSVTITNPRGTDLTMGLRGRKAFLDNGDCSTPGSGGNLPAGETFISPELGSSSGTLVFDGSISLYDGDIVIEEPIRTTVADGFVTSIEGGREAELLQKTVELGEKNALIFEKEGKISAGQGDFYRKNARNLGELGIGLNPLAVVSGNMLEDEKAYRTCHIAIGSNYDEDAPALIHLDGLVTEPTITARFEDGSEQVLLEKGELLL